MKNKANKATKTVQELAEELNSNLTTKERTNGDKYVCMKEEIEWQKEIVFAAHADMLPDDWKYRFIEKAACALAESEAGNEEESIDEIEPDVYTSDLTAWLHSHNGRVYYLTEALEEFDSKDGFQALSIAQQLEIREVAHAVLDGLRQYAESLEA